VENKICGILKKGGKLSGILYGIFICIKILFFQIFIILNVDFTHAFKVEF
jgi:tetrahydromethanopterin S-methyltransferase subunit G